MGGIHPDQHPAGRQQWAALGPRALRVARFHSRYGANKRWETRSDREAHEATGPAAFEMALTCPFALVTVTSENT